MHGELNLTNRECMLMEIRLSAPVAVELLTKAIDISKHQLHWCLAWGVLVSKLAWTDLFEPSVNTSRPWIELQERGAPFCCKDKLSSTAALMIGSFTHRLLSSELLLPFRLLFPRWWPPCCIHPRWWQVQISHPLSQWLTGGSALTFPLAPLNFPLSNSALLWLRNDRTSSRYSLSHHR